MFLRDRGRFLEIAHIEHDVTADGFLRFGEGAVDDALAARAGDDAGLEFERGAVERLAFGRESSYQAFHFVRSCWRSSAERCA